MVLFDLDGTLLDTRPGVRRAMQAALAEVLGGTPAVSELDWSLPLPGQVDAVIPREPPKVRRAVVDAFRRHYDGGLWADATVMPGAVACLVVLRAEAVRLFVVTNKRQRVAQLLLRNTGLAPLLDGIAGQADGAAPVPKSELAMRCLNEAGAPGVRVWVVGDSDPDEVMAAELGVPFIAVLSGTGPLSAATSSRDRVGVGSLADAARVVLRSHVGG